MRFHAYDETSRLLRSRTCYSVGGGFVVEEPADDAAPATADGSDDAGLPYPFGSAAELLDRCAESCLPVSGVMLANEASRRPAGQVRSRLLEIWAVMRQCVDAGCVSTGVLPGGLKVPRRAPDLYGQLMADPGQADPLRVMDWVNLFALALIIQSRRTHGVAATREQALPENAVNAPAAPAPWAWSAAWSWR